MSTSRTSPIAARPRRCRICSLAGSTITARSARLPSGPIENKSAKGIAILTRDRSPLFPTLRSAHEQGLTNFHADFWTGLFVPKGTPEPIVQKLNQAMQVTLNTPAVQERLLKIAVTVVAPERRSPAYLKSFVESETKLWEGIIKASGVELQ